MLQNKLFCEHTYSEHNFLSVEISEDEKMNSLLFRELHQNIEDTFCCDLIYSALLLPAVCGL